MCCPKCRAEYRGGFTECSDCNIRLVSEKPALKRPGDPGLEWVTVFEGDDLEPVSDRLLCAINFRSTTANKNAPSNTIVRISLPPL